MLQEHPFAWYLFITSITYLYEYYHVILDFIDANEFTSWQVLSNPTNTFLLEKTFKSKQIHLQNQEMK